MTRHRRSLAAAWWALSALGWMVCQPAVADAQRSRHGRVVYVQPHYAPWPWWGPYPYGPYAYPLVHYGVSSLRIQTHPEDAEVFVDGYFAGEVDQFNGIFQRLRLTPGGHEIAIFHEGYRTFRRQLYLRPAGNQTLRIELEPLGPGETSEVPAPFDRAPLPTTAPAGPPPEQSTAPAAPRRTGVVVLRVEPVDAEILIDREPIARPPGTGPITIELDEGRHTVEVRKAGYQPYSQDVLIRRNGRLPLTIRLDPR